MSNAPKDLDFINLNDINTAPPTVPAAEYHLKIVEGQIRENKEKTGYYFSYRAVIQSGEHAGDSIFGLWSFKEEALWKMKKDFKAMGYLPANGRPKIEDLIGFEGLAKIVEKPRNDDPEQKENKIDKWIAPVN
jgi:hypothetical protein